MVICVKHFASGDELSAHRPESRLTSHPVATAMLQSALNVHRTVTRLRHEFAIRRMRIAARQDRRPKRVGRMMRRRLDDGIAIVGAGRVCLMRVLVATDAWHPQVNGVVRTLTALAGSARRLGVAIEFLTPEGFPSLPVPTYPELALCAARASREIARRIEQARARRHPHRHRRADRAHGATLLPQARPAVHDQLHDAISRIHLGAAADPRILELCGAAPLPCRRRRHDGIDPFADGRARPARLPAISACGRAASTPSCSGRNAPIELDLPRPIFISVGRIAVEKNLEAFLSLDLPGIQGGDRQGPQEAELRRRFPGREISRPAGGPALAG